MPISSLDSPYGVGTLGKAAFQFADFLKEAGQTIWQILPVSPTSYGDSPYQSFSTFAGNPYFIDLELLCEEGLLTQAELDALDWGGDPTHVDYGKLYENRFPLLRLAAQRFWEAPSEDFSDFLRENEHWIADYALFMALKTYHNGAGWSQWEAPYRLRDSSALTHFAAENPQELFFWEFVQYAFDQQWQALHKYTRECGIEILGDLPIYVAPDSADVWANPQYFELDEQLRPLRVAGCPPDYFSPTGQLWGNPLYRWDVLEQDGYRWWLQRIQAAAGRYDLVRIDHFRGFESYYAIPAGDKTAENGSWMPGPGMPFFEKVQELLGDGVIIAEDLGLITDEVRQLLAQTGYPGMKVLEFAFQAWCDNDYLPHNYPKNCVVYTGTHDNDTLKGWLSTVGEADLEYLREYAASAPGSDTAWDMIRLAWSSTADTAITQMQDLLGLDSSARMNTPSTPMGNWCWRMEPGAVTGELAEKLARLTKLYRRGNC